MASGIIGMYISVRSNLRTAAAARRSLVEAVQVAMRGGAVSGFLVVALSLLGVYLIFVAYGGLGVDTVAEAPFLIVGFGFGASFVALFAQLGGGIYTKAADVGADLVGKVEAGIPEDDPRNAAVVADLVGDNVGDCAGRGADLFESTAAENIGAMILGVAVYKIASDLGWPHPTAWIFFPLVVRSFGLLATIVAMFFIRGREDEDPMNMLNRGYWVTTGLSALGLLLTTSVMMGTAGQTPSGVPIWLYFFGAGVVGLATSVAFVYITQYYTAGAWRPVQGDRPGVEDRPGDEHHLGHRRRLRDDLRHRRHHRHRPLRLPLARPGAFAGLGLEHNPGGVFGTAVATMGMLMTTAYILAMDTFGPITDNAGGITEFSRAEAGARQITDRLDAVGNTTKALTKGYAIASASLAAFLLFSRLHRQGQPHPRAGAATRSWRPSTWPTSTSSSPPSSPRCSSTSSAPSPSGPSAERRARSSSRSGGSSGSIPGSWTSARSRTTRGSSTSRPGPPSGRWSPRASSPSSCRSSSASSSATRPWPASSWSGTIAGVLLATVLNNGGGAWDNAKKYIEAGHLTDEQGNVIGKKTEAHAAAVVGDTVGDPFKDTAGPSLHVLVKLLATITLVLAPLFIR
ncbi:MAG: hypothetical protein KatS3mg065_1157 [Chloroflexota bacterium]|nr:MAG: hypothetical protein KatS3mg065_1157 [Chloroflexota bacterium]